MKKNGEILWTLKRIIQWKKLLRNTMRWLNLCEVKRIRLVSTPQCERQPLENEYHLTGERKTKIYGQICNATLHKREL